MKLNFSPVSVTGGRTSGGRHFLHPQKKISDTLNGKILKRSGRGELLISRERETYQN